MSNKKITISVTGPNASGKTHVIAAIHNMLKEHGLENKVTILHDSSSGAYTDVRERVSNASLYLLLPDLEIDLVEQYGNAPARKEVQKDTHHQLTTKINAGLLADKRVPLIPVYRPESAGFFVDQTLFEPTMQVVKDGEEAVPTSYLAFGKKLDLMGISTTQPLLDAGVHNYTDSIDPAIGLKQIAWNVGGKGMVSLVEQMPFTMGFFTPNGNFRDLAIKFTGTLPFNGDNHVKVEVAGTINIEMCTCELNATVLESNLPKDQWPVPVGYSLNVFRNNLNYR